MSNTIERLDAFLEGYDDASDTRGLDFYDDLTPLYDAFYNEHYDYEAQAEIIEQYSELSPGDKIVEGACGTGRLLQQLEDKYTAVGFDISSEMLKIAEHNTNAVLFRSNLEDFFVPGEVDGVFVFGNAVFHIPPEDRKQFFENTYENMSNQSTFIFSFMDANDIQDGYSDADVYTIGNWKVRRNSITDFRAGNEMGVVYSFRISDVDDDYTRLQVGLTTEGYVHQPKEIEEELHNTGFTNITITKPEKLPHTIAIARKVS